MQNVTEYETMPAQTSRLRPKGWARVLPAFKPPYSKNLRAGTWYPVVKDNLPDRVTLIVAEREVQVPRKLLDIRRQRPGNFSVVYGKADPSARGRRTGRGMRYGVCPECLERFPLRGTIPAAVCPKCHYQAPIGWDD